VLEALVVVWPNMIMVEYEAEFSQYPTQDLCFVMIICSKYFWDWAAGARGGVDFWIRADTFIAQKKRGDVASTSRLDLIVASLNFTLQRRCACWMTRQSIHFIK
jgi:hypothetical protein